MRKSREFELGAMLVVRRALFPTVRDGYGGTYRVERLNVNDVVVVIEHRIDIAGNHRFVLLSPSMKYVDCNLHAESVEKCLWTI